MPSLEIPEDLEDAIGKFVSIDTRDEQKLQSYSEVAELLSRYAKNAKCYASFPNDTKAFADRVNKALKTLDIYMEMTTYNDAFGQCGKQWKETTEQVAEFITNLMKSLDELRVTAATTSKPVKTKEVGAKATTVKDLLAGRNRIRADEEVTLVGDAFGKTGFVRVDTASGDRAVVPLINLVASGENTELLTFFMSSVEKTKQYLEKTRKEVTAKFWALARSYFQSRSKQEFVTLVDSKSWKQATEILLKMDDGSTGFSFRSCINGILGNAVGKSLPASFEISAEETEALNEIISRFQSLVQLLSQSSNSLRPMDKIWGEDWQRILLSVHSLHRQLSTTDIQRTSTLQGNSEDYQLQTVQQHTTRKLVMASNSYETTVASISEQQQQHSYNSMRSQDSALQQMFGKLDHTDNEVDIHRVSRSRGSSITSDSGKWPTPPQLSQRAPAMKNTSSPLPSPALMSARMESRESRRGIVDDFCNYERRNSDASVKTGSVGIVSEEEFAELRKQLQEAKRQLARIEIQNAQTSDSQIIKDIEQKSVRFNLSASPASPTRTVIDVGCHGDLALSTSWARAGKESEERMIVCRTVAPVISASGFNKEVVHKENSLAFQEPPKPLVTESVNFCHPETPIVDCGANLEVKVRDSSAIFREIPKALVTSSVLISKEFLNGGVSFREERPAFSNTFASLEVSCRDSLVIFRETPKAVATSSVIIGKELLNGRASFREERPALANTFAAKVMEQVAQSASAKIDYKASNCRAVASVTTHRGVKFQPDAISSDMKSLGKPIVDNGVFRINEMIDSWTDMQIKKPAASGAHFVLERRDARTQKNTARTPQVECGVGANLDEGVGRLQQPQQEAASVQTTQSSHTVECGAIGNVIEVVISEKRRRTRGTDMCDRQTICDTGVWASTVQMVKVETEDLARRRRQPQSAKVPTLPPKPAVQQKPQQLQMQPPPPQPPKPQQQQPQPPQPSKQQQPQPQPPQPSKQQPALQQPDKPQLQKQPQPSTIIQPHFRTKSEDIPDKEWRFPINRQDFRQDPTSQPESPDPQASKPRQSQPRPRHSSLPRLRKHRQQQQQQQQQQPNSPPPETQIGIPAGMVSMQAKVEPATWGQDSRHQWSSRSIHIGTRPASSMSNQRSSRSQIV